MKLQVYRNEQIKEMRYERILSRLNEIKETKRSSVWNFVVEYVKEKYLFKIDYKWRQLFLKIKKRDLIDDKQKDISEIQKEEIWQKILDEDFRLKHHSYAELAKIGWNPVCYSCGCILNETILEKHSLTHVCDMCAIKMIDEGITRDMLESRGLSLAHALELGFKNY